MPFSIFQAKLGDEYWSDRSYEFQEQHADAIIRTTGYYRRDYGLSVIHVSSTEHSLIQESILTPHLFPSASLGNLNKLPVELLFQVLRHMDMQTLFHLRQVNARARQIVDSLKEYKAVVAHGLTAYAALLRTKLAAHVTLLDFYRVLCSKQCSFCGKFGGFVFLPSWIRCCFECIEEDPETRMVTVAEVRRLFRLSRDELSQQRSFQTLPGMYATGVYSMEQSLQKSRVKIVPYFPAMKKFGERWDHEVHPQPSPCWDPIHNFMACCELPYYNNQTHEVEYGLSCAGCDLAYEKGILRSSDDQWDDRPWDRVFSREKFLKHFRICAQAQLLWESSANGTIEPIDKPEVARTGGYFRDR